jgi:hypothetical protein
MHLYIYTHTTQPIKYNCNIYNLITSYFSLSIIRTNPQQEDGYFWYGCLFGIEKYKVLRCI